MGVQVKSITKKSQNISEWFNDVVEQAKLGEHGPVRGTIIIRPYGYAIWEAIQKELDLKIKDLGAENAYFPLFIPYSYLQKEKSHVKGFSPELAIVTHAGGEKLSEPIVVRPTSETIMYQAYSRWIQSFRDLPLKVNSWNNVVRWEKRPYLFLRTTEFLWQEGHTAHETQEEAQSMVEDAINAYADLYKSFLGIWGYIGKKSESEKFAGADQTLTYEILMPDGKALQGGTSHNLGQNFSKVFDVKYQDKTGQTRYVWQTSWGYTTRSVGALILVHGDDNGLVLPPMIAPTQAVVIPIVAKDSDRGEIDKFTKDVFALLEGFNVRVKVDDRDQSPGWKFNQYDLAGVPLRIEIGGREVESQAVTVFRRDNSERQTVSVKELGEKVNQILDQMQSDLLDKSKKFTQENTFEVNNYDDFKKIMQTTRGFLEAFWCEDPACETKIKEETKASTRCLPLGSPVLNGKCIYCGKPAKHRWLFAQSY